MKREEILAQWDSMTPRERDALVADKVMGWKVSEDAIGVQIVRHSEEFNLWKVFNPSTDISAAWEVVEKMKRAGWGITITSWGDDEAMGEDPYLVTFGFLGGPANFMSLNLSEAICKAALLSLIKEETP